MSAETGTSTSTSAADTSSSAPSADGSTTAAAVSTTSTSSSGGMMWDMGMPDFDPPQPAGCKGKIDFLFVVSSGGNMHWVQEQLVPSLPKFMDALEAKFPNFDYHILSANTDKSFALADCGACTDSCDPQGELPFCGAQFTVCDKKIGAGVTFPTGLYASNRRCDLDSGRRYITPGQQDLAETFTCMTQVGNHGSAVAGGAMVAALQPAINDPDDEYACNGGFLRKDALLVVTIIQDDYDVDSPGTVDEWIEALRAAKDYDDDAFAVLLLTTDIDVGYNQLCFWDQYNETKNRLRLLAEGVEHNFIGSICLEEYASFFTEHVGALVDLCNDFVPPG